MLITEILYQCFTLVDKELVALSFSMVLSTGNLGFCMFFQFAFFQALTLHLTLGNQ